MINKIIKFLGNHLMREAEEGVENLQSGVRVSLRSVLRLSTIFYILVAEVILIAAYVLFNNPESVNRIASKENVSVGDVLGLLPSPPILIILVVVIAFAVVFVRFYSTLRSEMGWHHNRY